MTNRNNFADAQTPNPSGQAVAVTPSDATDLGSTRGLYIGVGGNLVVTMLDNTNVTFVAVPSGTILPIRVQKVRATGTTASSIVALY